MRAVTGIRAPKGFYKSNRQRLVESLKAKSNCGDDAVILLKGAYPQYIYDDGKKFDE
jgi:hypothetical protein